MTIFILISKLRRVRSVCVLLILYAAAAATAHCEGASLTYMRQDSKPINLPIDLLQLPVSNIRFIMVGEKHPISRSMKTGVSLTDSSFASVVLDGVLRPLQLVHHT